MIDIKKTVANILAVKDVQFKLLKEDEKTGTTTLVTAVNDEFNRGILIVEPQRIGIGTQGPDANGTLQTVFQPVSLELIEQIVMVEDPEPKKVTPAK